MKISVIVATRNRPDKILQCIDRIIANSFSDFEIIVVDQSDFKLSFISKSLFNNLKLKKKLKIFHVPKKGLSFARNFGVKNSSCPIIAFTDDDCLVDKNWLSEIYSSFKKYQNVIGVFGQVLPYMKHLHSNEECPCTFTNKKKRIISAPLSHYKYIGFGNNMAFRKDAFEKNGVFKQWLGPGSIGLNGEDAEFALRIIGKHHKILYNPKVRVFHNRWLKKEEHSLIKLSYICGEVACYSYYKFQGYDFAKPIIEENLKDSLVSLRGSFKTLLSRKSKKNVYPLLWNLRVMYMRLRGLGLGFYFSIVDSIA